MSQTVIFVNTRRNADWLYDQMRQRDFPVAITHAQMSAGDRAAILAGARSDPRGVIELISVSQTSAAARLAC